MTVRSYDELQTIFADNTTGNISPQDMRDLIDSLSISRSVLDDRVATTQTIAVANTYEALAVTALAGDITNSIEATLGTDGVVTLNVEGIYEVVYIANLDLSNLPNNSEVRIQWWASDTNNGLDWIPFSAEESFTRTSQNTSEIIRLATQQAAFAIPRYLRPSIKSTSTDNFELSGVYISVTSNPAVKPNA